MVIYVGQDRLSPYSPGWPGTHHVAEAGTELMVTNPLASVFQMLVFTWPIMFLWNY